MKRYLIWGALACGLLISTTAHASKLIAVLPLDISNTEGKLSKAARIDLEEMLRDVASDALSPAGWTVLTGETTLQVLQDNGVDSTKCGDQNCHLSMAREIKAEKFLSGNVRFVEGTFTASIRLIDTRTGRILASQSIEGESVRALRADFKGRADKFFSKGGMMSGSAETTPPDSSPPSTTAPEVSGNGPKLKRSAITAAVGGLTILAKPKEGVRLDVTDPDGKKSSSGSLFETKEAKPGHWSLVARANGYEDQEQSFEVIADDVTLIKVELKLLGSLKITGKPAGSAVSVTGPGGFKDESGLPWEAEGLRSGQYSIKVSRDGYSAEQRTIEVQPGRTAELDVALSRGGSSGKWLSTKHRCEPTRIRDWGSIFSTHVFGSDERRELMAAGFSEQEFDEINTYMHESHWPSGMQQLQQREKRRPELQSFNVCVLGWIHNKKEAVLAVSPERNTSSPADLRLDREFYVNIKADGL